MASCSRCAYAPAFPPCHRTAVAAHPCRIKPDHQRAARLNRPLRARAISSGGMKLSWPDIWKASAAVAGYSWRNRTGFLSSMILARSPGHLLVLKIVEGLIFGLPRREMEPRRHRLDTPPARTTARRRRTGLHDVRGGGIRSDVGGRSRRSRY